MSTTLGRIATLDRIERISFFETLFAPGKKGRASFLLILAQSGEASRAAFYEGMHGNAVTRWEDQRLALDPFTADAVRTAEQFVLEILEDVTRIAAGITASGIGLSQFSEGEVQLLTALNGRDKSNRLGEGMPLSVPRHDREGQVRLTIRY